jgi:Cu-Zn family superoxide dismutase
LFFKIFCNSVSFMKILTTTTIIAIALCAACAHKDSNQSSTAVQPVATPAPVEKTGPSAAQATLKAAKKQKVKGVVHFTQSGDKVKVEAMLEGLKPGPHGFHIHENGDCSAADFASAGGHFNPAKHEHGAPDAAASHEGDMGNIIADKKGKAKFSMEFPNMKLGGDGAIVGKALIVHEKPDDLKTQPTGNAGGRIACGVIEAL